MEEILLWQMTGAGFCMAASLLLRCGCGGECGNGALALLCPVNGSVWEELKLLVLPMLLFSAAEYVCYARALPGYVPVRMLSICYGMATAAALRCICTAVLRRVSRAVCALTLCIGISEAYLLGTLLLLRGALTGTLAVSLGYLALVGLLAAFVRFTFRPPAFPLFRAPATERRGRRMD